MKKTLLVTQMFPPILGGGPNLYYQVVRSLPADDIVVLAHKTKAYEENLAGLDFPFKTYHKPFFFKSRFIWPKWLKLIWEMYLVMRKEKPEIIWNGEVLPAGIVVWLFSRLYRVPFFTSSHGADVLNPLMKPGRKGKWKRLLVNFVLHRSKFIMCNSEFTRLQVSKYGITRERSFVIYPCATYTPNHSPPYQGGDKGGVKITSPTIERINKLKSKGYKILLTTVAHLVRRKGIDSVIEALPYVWEKYEKVAYVIVGEGTYKAYLEKRAIEVQKERHPNDKIIFAGAVSDDELKKIFSLCDIFIMLPRIIAGLIEGFGIVYIEANSFGKPVIGDKVGGVPEAIVDLYDGNEDKATGLLVGDSQNPRQVAKKILMLLKDEGLAKKLGSNGVKWAEQFKWEEQAKKLIERLSHNYFL